MPAKPSDPDMRRRLLEAAATTLASDGLGALSTRRLAAQVGSSTMAVYTHFGSIAELVRAVAREGFQRLAEHIAAVPQTDSPLDDLLALGWAYRQNALDNRALYAVMFGLVSGGDQVLAKSISEDGRYTFDALIAGTQRVLDAGLFRPGDAEAIAAQLWSSLHGYVSLELAGYFADEPAAVDDILLPLMINLGTGLATPSLDPGPAG
jgi:AcrR family transcriptional regulator